MAKMKEIKVQTTVTPQREQSGIVDGFYYAGGVYKQIPPMRLSDIHETPPPGVYEIGTDRGVPLMVPVHLHTDLIIDPGKTSPIYSITEEIEKFLTPDARKIMADFKQIHRRGILLEGPPGSGKTTIINSLCKKLSEAYGFLCFLNPNPRLFSEVGKKMHALQPNQFFFVVYEDFENWMDNTDLLALLDGQMVVPNTIYFATTNYIDKIPARIRKRPSRFAHVMNVGTPDAEIRRGFLSRHLPEIYLNQINLEEWVTKSDGLLVDHLKHLAQYVFVFKKELDEAVALLRELSVVDLKTDD